MNMACKLTTIPLLLLLGGWILDDFACGEDQAVNQSTAQEKPQRKNVVHRLSAEFMETFDRDRSALAKRVKSFDVPYAFVRGTFHMHSLLSHDSQGTLDEITAAAKATGTQIVGFTEHPSRAVDVVAENVTGWRDGVYFLAGTESSNELHWPGREGEDDLRFVSHPEEVPSFDRAKYDGIEIYNTHSDAIDEPVEILMTGMVLNMGAVRAHPEAAFCSFLDWPEEFLARYDQLTSAGRFAGIAANDSHQNQGLRIRAMPDGSVEVLDTAGEQVWKDDGWQAKVILAAFGQSTRPTDPAVLASLQLDPYEISMRHVGTFLQIETIDEKSVRSALRGGRVILGFELVAPLPAVGFGWSTRGCRSERSAMRCLGKRG